LKNLIEIIKKNKYLIIILILVAIVLFFIFRNIKVIFISSIFLFILNKKIKDNISNIDKDIKDIDNNLKELEEKNKENDKVIKDLKKELDNINKYSKDELLEWLNKK